jgi:hypothetical protein
MKTADNLTLAGIVVTATGSTLGVLGIILQTNGYYPFRWLDLFRHLFSLAREAISQGMPAAWKTLEVTAGLAERKGENRAKSLVGLYLVLLGFFLQLVGSILLAVGIFAI